LEAASLYLRWSATASAVGMAEVMIGAL
jgi:hypothetical protein